MTSLFFKECKKVLCSITYLIMVAVLILFTYSQLLSDFGENKMTKPQPGDSYGTHGMEIPEQIMPNATESLFREFCSNSYIAYPFGFYKNVKLSGKKQNSIANVLSELTGETASKLLASVGTEDAEGLQINVGDGSGLTQDKSGNYVLEYGKDTSNDTTSPAIDSVAMKIGLAYERFRELMNEADRIIGGGSQYSGLYLINNFGQTAITYEEALNEYNAILKNDNIIGAYARLFCDYLGMMMAILPVFLAVALCLKDRRASMYQFIYSRRASSLKIVSGRFLALLAMTILPLLVFDVIFTHNVSNMYPGAAFNVLTYFKYTAGWLMPSAMVAIAVGMLLTELTSSPIAIAVQGLWWFLDMFTGMREMKGGYGGFVLSPRHNALGNTQVFVDSFGALAVNRLFYSGLAILLVGLTVLVYEQNRRGRLNGYHRFKALFSDRMHQYKV